MDFVGTCVDNQLKFSTQQAVFHMRSTKKNAIVKIAKPQIIGLLQLTSCFPSFHKDRYQRKWITPKYMRGGG